MSFRKLTEMKSGEKKYPLKINFFVGRGLMVSCLTNYFYRYSEKQLEGTTKKLAYEIIKSELKNHGAFGEYGGMDGVGDDNQEEYNSIYSSCSDWVDTNYPQLQQQE